MATKKKENIEEKKKEEKRHKKVVRSLTIANILRMMAMGNTFEEIADYYHDGGYTKNTVRHLIDDAKVEIRKKIDSNSSKVADKNIERLEVIISETYEKGQYRECETAIDLLNKMCHLYTEKIQVEGKDKIILKFEK